MTKKISILLLLSLCEFSAFTQTIEFIENKGQWDSRVKYMGNLNGGAFFVEQDGFTVVQHDAKDWQAITDKIHGHAQEGETTNQRKTLQATILKSHAYKVSFLGGAAAPEIIADKPLFTYNNYFIGNDPSKWASNCKIYQGVTIKNIYPNIDIRYYAGQGSLKYDLIVHPGGNPNNIALKYDSVDALEIKNKELIIKTSVGDLKELNPYTYQYNETGRVTIAAKYTLKDKVVRFDVKNYDPKTTLVIDPDLIFCSFAGSNSSDNWGFTATYGPDGSMYGGGIVMSSGFPTSLGSYQGSFAGGEFDIGIIKLTPDGRNRVYATYIGGNQEDQPHSLVVNDAGELILAGRTNSPISGAGAYPLRNSTTDVYGGGSYDIIITKLNSTGTGIIGSVRIGGSGEDGVNITANRSLTSLQRNYGDDGRSEINLDALGNIYVASCTRSTGTPGSNFPVVNPFQATPGGAQDGVVLKFNPTLSTLLYSSFLGGTGNDAAYVLSISPVNGDLYVAGGTASNSLPGTGGLAISNSNAGIIDGFVTRINSNSGAIIKTTFVGTDREDQVYGIQFDLNGFPYIMGQTGGTWPVINAPFSQLNGKQFISKLQPDLSAYVYSTVFGKGQSAPDISPTAFLVDRCENVYVSGWGGRLSGYNFPNAGTSGLTTTPDALKSTVDFGPSGTGEDFYFFVLKKDAASQLYGSFFGQNNGAFPDHVDGGTSRFDKNGVIYQAICASCGTNAGFPTTPGVWSPTKPPAANCNLAMVKIAFNFAGTKGDVRPSINGVPRDSTGCVPLTVDFTDTIQEASLYEWNFGDSGPGVDTITSLPTVSHTYNFVGTYIVTMVAIDSTKCFPRDTSYVTVKVGDNQALPDFNAVKLSPPCDTFRYRFDNTTIAPLGIPFKANTFTWDFGDGSPRVTNGGAPVFHTYANDGAYNVTLLLNDTSYCNSPDDTVKILRVAANVVAAFTTPRTGCAPYPAEFKNESEGGSQFTWDFGDGTSIQSSSPTVNHTYQFPGIYTITLTALDSNTCNIIDTAMFTITVSSIPTALFSAAPQPPQLNKPISFTNLSSSDAIRFKWVWGDGDSLLTTSRNVIQYEFNLTGTYNTCLSAYNAQGCEARYCERVNNIVEPAIDVPNAFTPNSGDINSRVFVRGFGIAKMKFAIYARWGEKVFETADRKIGWDGRYKGKVLPMDVYAYTLDVEFVDGKKYRKTGDITLIK